MSQGQVRVRIAPSPTGDPHVGTAYIALFNYVFAKSMGGQFILRIEDTDRQRTRQSSEEMIISSLKWLGLDWDEGPDVGGEFGPYRQSERTEIYRGFAAQLVKEGKAYLEPGTTEVVRFRMPDEGMTEFEDELRGTISIENAQQNDPVLIKSDGYPTYHLANVVDDHLMKITHVIRAEEWISSTPKHVQLYKAFGWIAPKWVHMPLLRNSDKSKISKRKNSVSLSYYMKAGILPEAMKNFLGLMGWSIGSDREVFSVEEMQKAFQLKSISLGGPVFDTKKLNWLNQQYLQKLPVDEFVDRMGRQLFDSSYLRQIGPLVQNRIARFDEFIDKHAFFFSGDIDYQNMSICPKSREKEEFFEMLERLADRLDSVDTWEVAALKNLFDDLISELGWKAKEVFMPVRLIATGRRDSPPLMETLAVLGKDLVRSRLRQYLLSGGQ